jgi:predicted acylesterase/phospholipase RssA
METSSQDVIKDTGAALEKHHRKIKHLVISGGTVWGFSVFGILEEAIETGFLHMDDIESIYATSVGTILGTMFALKIETHLLRDYLIRRPWETLCKQNRHSVLEIYDGKGIVHRGFFENMFSPLLKSVDLSCDITLADFYAYNGIEIHFYTTELNQYELIDISFKTHPEWRLIDAIYASSSVPLLFSPLIIENKCYVDGGFLLNYPISKCLENVENINEVLGISLGNLQKDSKNFERQIHSGSSVLDVVSLVINNVIYYNSLFTNDNSHLLDYQIILSQTITLEYLTQVLYSKEERELLITNGRKEFSTHFQKWCLSHHEDKNTHFEQTV